MILLHKRKLVITILVTIVVVLQYRLLFASDGLIHAFRLQSMISEQQGKNGDIVKHNDSLVREIDSLKKGGVAIESRARADLGMVKKGEVFYQVVE